MITKTYMIPEENIENLEKKFNAAARKIRKINPEFEPTMTKSNHTILLCYTILRKKEKDGIYYGYYKENPV